MNDALLTAAAQLLVQIAGPEPVQIEMAARGPKKYYELHRRLTEQDARAHLVGRSTRGATLRHPGGMTRALCYDADTSDDWLRLVEAAWHLAEQGYRPLLEVSPAGRGGHLWIIYTALVQATWAHRHVGQVAPTLAHISERWPAESGHKVRLPGGLYVQPGRRAWCKLYDVYGKPLSSDGASAAYVLLTQQTPAELVQAYPDADHIEETGELAAVPNNGVGQRSRPAPMPSEPHTPGVDEQWQRRYGRSFWFRFTPAMLAAWYNERAQVEEILPPEKNGMGLASWRGERTASVGLRAARWVDFGASARREDGKQDGGDALELTVRVTQDAKPEVMRQIARQLVREAREALESAAWRGEQPPAWVQPFMSPAGWQRYHALRTEAARAATHTRGGGVAGFYSLAEQHKSKERNTPVNNQQHRKSQHQDVLRPKIRQLSDQEVTQRYAQELLKLKTLNQFGRHSERFLGYPNTLVMNLCRRELECRGLPVPPVNPPEEEGDTNTSKAARETSDSPVSRENNS